jgi:alkaline phosphatase
VDPVRDVPSTSRSRDGDSARAENVILRFVVDWTTGGHTGADIPLTATGPGAERLGGHHANTFVHRVVVETLFGTG